MGEGVELLEGERLDDLLTHGLRIIQSDEVFSFSLDAVLLARFCTVPVRGAILDLCSGNGVIPLLLTTRTRANIVGVELQRRLADMAMRSVRWNGLDGQIRIIQGDLREAHLTLGYGRFDLVTVNPPYLPATGYDTNKNEYFALARHEIACTLEDVIAACSRQVKSGGKVAMVHRPARLADVISLMRKYRLEPKRMRLVHPRSGQEANIVLIECIRDGGPELRVLPPLVVHADNGAYGPELMRVYYGDSEGLDA
jgi:tRNA1(Val) A37 N6-methylase TrmN6